jgi:multicomponent Na+:H+ antiporter subunit G
MAPATDLVVMGLLTVGAVFFTAGTVGLLRFPDTQTRLHAVTKADNLGMGLVVVGLAVASGSPLVGAKLGLVWAIALAASATSTHLIANHLDRIEGEGG